jgi:hypothetical protein
VIYFSFRIKDILNRFRFNTLRSQDIKQIYSEYTSVNRFSTALKKQQELYSNYLKRI